MHSPCARRHPPLSPPAGRYGPGNVLGRFAPERRMGSPRGRPMLYGRRALEEQMNNLTQYRAAAPSMLPGDVIAFAGRAPLSFIIDGYTGSKLSHVAMVRGAPPRLTEILAPLTPSQTSVATGKRVHARKLKGKGQQQDETAQKRKVARSGHGRRRALVDAGLPAFRRSQHGSDHHSRDESEIGRASRR